MNEIKYLEERLNDQIDWYEKKSKTNKLWFKSLKLIEIISAALIPFIAGFGTSISYYSEIIGILGIIIAISAGTTSLFKFHENWIEYRTTAETMKHEKYLYLTKTIPYNNDEAFNTLVQRVEGLISKENSQWSRYIDKTKTV